LVSLNASVQHWVLRKCGLTNKPQPIAKPSCGSGWTNIAEHFILTSTLVFQSAAVVGGRNTNATPAQSPARYAISLASRFSIRRTQQISAS
jgi:hypothetical protein